MRLRRAPDRRKGLLLVITAMTAGKCWFSFEVAAQSQTASCTALEPAIQSPANAKQTRRE